MASLAQLAELTGTRVRGDAAVEIEKVAPLNAAGAGSISFLAHPAYRRHLAGTAASAVILAEEFVADCPVPMLVSDNPYATYARVAEHLYPRRERSPGISDGAVIDSTATVGAGSWVAPHVAIEADVTIGEHVEIGAGCSIGENVRIGEGSRLGPNVTVLGGVVIGRRAIVHPGVVIGADGFGIAMDGGAWRKVPQLGSVIIGDDVEIGANTTIDRGALEDTVIGNGVKLDNQIQVAHNVRIGEHTAIAGCVGIAGSAVIGSYCCIGGNAGILGHLEIADHVNITAKTLVTHSIRKPGTYSSGVPVQENSEWRRNAVRFKRLDQDLRRLEDSDDNE